MKVDLREAWVGRRRGVPTCPDCGGDEVRYSRREYEGLWGRLLRVRPAKCLACGGYFPIAGRGVILRAESAHADLRLPFKPVELDRPPASSSGGGGRRPWWTRTRRSCPSCGSSSVRAGQPAPGVPALVRRLDLQDNYRCLDCNADFVRVNLPGLLTLGLAFALILGGLSYAVMNTLGRGGRSPSSPTIKKGQIPPPPPPVFR